MSSAISSRRRGKGGLDPILMMIGVIAVAVLLTYVVGAGQFQRHGALVVPGSYQAMPKTGGIAALLSPQAKTASPKDTHATAAGLVAAFAAIPAGLVKNANLEFLVLLVGGMFGVLRRTGAVDAGVDRLIHATAGNRFVLVPTLMIALALGSTLLGFISEYLVLVPIMALMGERLGYKPIFAVAVVGVAAKIGYATSVTNPYALVVAQPLAHVPLFSGLAFRLVLFVVFLALGIVYVLWRVRPVASPAVTTDPERQRLSPRHLAVLLSLLAAGLIMVFGSIFWGWKEDELGTFYVGAALLFAIAGGLAAADAADAFVEGMKNLMLAALLIGLAGSVQILLQNAHVLDTMINDATEALHGQGGAVTANGLMGIEMFLGVLIPSTAGKVTVSMPILAPVAQLSGVSGQTTVLAFILGNGLTNMVTPTSGMLLAYLAAARVDFGQWIRFIAPLFGVLLLLSAVALGVAVAIGY
jgi:uncharacterized ion transporter superfamily protein YfcC